MPNLQTYIGVTCGDMESFRQRKISQSDCEISSNCGKKSMCSPKGCGFLAIVVRNTASVLALLVLFGLVCCRTLADFLSYMSQSCRFFVGVKSG